jgi:hypothetical protein
MMQAFNKKLDDLQKDLEKVKRNQAGTQRNTSRISDIKKDTECFKCGQPTIFQGVASENSWYLGTIKVLLPSYPVNKCILLSRGTKKNDTPMKNC